MQKLSSLSITDSRSENHWGFVSAFDGADGGFLKWTLNTQSCGVLPGYISLGGEGALIKGVQSPVCTI